MTRILRFVAVALALLVLGWPAPPASAGSGTVPDLYAHSVARALEQRFDDQDLSFLLLHARTSEILGARWEDADQPVPMGSLLKPFTALAWGETHSFRYPEHVCHGTRGGCWLPRGHGRLGLTAAVAHSCNAYFHALAEGMHAEDVSSVLRRYGLPQLPPEAAGDELFGAGNHWRAQPAAVARAYVRLVKRAEDPGAHEIVHGMMLSAELGTGSAVGHAVPEHAALVKTGTAPCQHARHAPGDGFVVLLYPAASPQFVLLVRRHGKPGSEAAAVAGEMLRFIAGTEEGS
ncbi:MAG TPA: penicillin-binding transpeptidase domain-containing protein [Terriglobales bacterium]|nr:penicillin-binding transpeptidase domain-containing protein [Terriglobales bacterium]